VSDHAGDRVSRRWNCEANSQSSEIANAAQVQEQTTQILLKQSQ
jgi:hypothetical protein